LIFNLAGKTHVCLSKLGSFRQKKPQQLGLGERGDKKQTAETTPQQLPAEFDPCPTEQRFGSEKVAIVHIFEHEEEEGRLLDNSRAKTEQFGDCSRSQRRAAKWQLGRRTMIMWLTHQARQGGRGGHQMMLLSLLDGFSLLFGFVKQETRCRPFPDMDLQFGVRMAQDMPCRIQTRWCQRANEEKANIWTEKGRPNTKTTWKSSN
jgi:hypothetical protein